MLKSFLSGIAAGNNVANAIMPTLGVAYGLCLLAALPIAANFDAALGLAMKAMVVVGPMSLAITQLRPRFAAQTAPQAVRVRSRQ